MESPKAPRRYEPAADPFSTVIVDDLLQGLNEWRNIQDIVRLTVKALTDVVKAQGSAIKDIERQLPQKASKAELSMSLAQKANLQDTSQVISELQESLNEKLNSFEIRALVEEKVSKSELQYLLGSKISVEEARQLLESKANLRDIDNAHQQIQLLRNEIESLPSGKDVEFLKSQLKEKADWKDVEEALETKANKQTVASALHRKANRVDIDAILGQKADSNEVKEVLRALENKADYSSLEQLSLILDKKLEKEEFYTKILPEISKRSDIDSLFSNIEKLNYQLEAATRNSQHEIEETRKFISSNFSLKADLKDIDKIFVSLSQKADHSFMLESIDNLKRDLKDLANDTKKEFSSGRKRSEEAFEVINKLKEDIARLKDDVIGVVELTRSDVDEQSKTLKSLISANRDEIEKEISEAFEHIENLKADLVELADSSVDKGEIVNMKQGITTLYETKASIGEVSTELTSVQKDMLNKLQDLKDQISNKFSRIETELFRNLDDKASLLEVQGLLSTKLDLSQASKMLVAKANVEDLNLISSQLQSFRDELYRKFNPEEIDLQVKSSKLSLEYLEKELLLKANIKDMCTLLDMKANIIDTNRALSEIHKELDVKVNLEEFSGYMRSQQPIIEALCADNCSGRWIWKSGELRSGNAIPWEMQISNSAPDNFLWEKEKTSVVTVAPGLYELYFGFYSRKRPSIQILINGEPIILASKSLSSSAQSSKTKTGNHPAGNITGLTFIDFVALPSRARVSMSYTGEAPGEGFFCLRKL
ncbi:unnamed protein product [Blepharisma stoltei]|uniref:C1q domain-containing protein n=1 Tax=Blepharisma stoltei TaxID=1481888 RepID=A0AAU9JRG2_9CILI|nr:unnamed protein product [Blepharisma stoltei]